MNGEYGKNGQPAMQLAVQENILVIEIAIVIMQLQIYHAVVILLPLIIT